MVYLQGRKIFQINNAMLNADNSTSFLNHLSLRRPNTSIFILNEKVMYIGFTHISSKDLTYQIFAFTSV